MSKLIKELQADLERASAAFSMELLHRLSQLDSAPKSPSEVEAALVALAEAEADCSEHFERFPREAHSVPWEQQSEEVREDWVRANGRRNAAVKVLLEMGQAMLARKQEAA